MEQQKKKRGPKPLAPGMKRVAQLRANVTRIELRLFLAACKVNGIKPTDKLREIAVEWAGGVLRPACKKTASEFVAVVQEEASNA